MLRFIIKRLASGVLLLVAICSGTFFMAYAAIGDPTPGLLGNNATDDMRASLREKLGLDRPLLTQFWDWISHAVVGDFGQTWRGKGAASAPTVIHEIMSRMPVTLSLVAAGMIVAGALGILVGILTAMRPDGWLDRSLKLASVVLFALPGFWFALMLVLIFAVKLKWFPAVGFVNPFDAKFHGLEGIGPWLNSIVLPTVALSLGAIVMVAEQLRNGIVETNGQDFVRTLRARGLSNRKVLTHVLRNASPAALTILALMFVGLLSGAVVIEIIFFMPGIGQLTLDASKIGDIPILLGLTALTIVFVVIVNLLLDLLLGIINPKARNQ